MQPDRNAITIFAILQGAAKLGLLELPFPT